jgi:hypothetical protein
MRCVTLGWREATKERLMGTDDVGARDFRFGVTGVLAMVIVAILLAILS